jgi:hypothetical protein
MMIKRITFANFDRNDDAAVTSWRSIVARALDAPPDVRPVRLTCCTTMPEEIPNPAHDGVGLAWFPDAPHLERFEEWLSANPVTQADDVLGPASTAVVVANEHVLRGADWLAQRWSDGGERLKHMAIARRAHGLTPAEFSEMWQNRVGKVGTTPIPDVARGCAYVQNHPVARRAGDWLYDAVNEVWFDELDALRNRIHWMTEALKGGTEDDMVSENSFLAVREEVVLS